MNMSINITTIINSFLLFYLSGEFCMFEDKSLRRIGAYDTISHFAYNFAKCSPILNILLAAN